MKTRIVLSVSILMIAIITVLSSPVSWAQPVKEVIVGNISATTGPTSGTHMMCQTGSQNYLEYLNEKMGGIAG